jgi:hypothetical protein
MAKEKAAGGFSGLRRSEREPWCLFRVIVARRVAWWVVTTGVWPATNSRGLYPCIAIRQASSEIASC